MVRPRSTSRAGALLSALLVIGSGALGVTGRHGDEKVYRYGLGVLSLPKSDSHMHFGVEAAPHEHGLDGHDHGGVAPKAPGDMSGMPGMTSSGDKAQPTDVPTTSAPGANPLQRYPPGQRRSSSTELIMVPAERLSSDVPFELKC